MQQSSVVFGNTYCSFGAGFASEQTGIILNNEMADFSPPNTFSFYGLPPSPANFIRPGKRPLSSMTPAIVVDDSSGRCCVRLVVGAAGGIRITTSTAYVALYLSLKNCFLFVFEPNHSHISLSYCFFHAPSSSSSRILKAMIRNLWFGEDIKEAIDSPRFHHQLFPMTLNYEEGFPKVYVYYATNRKFPLSLTDILFFFRKGSGRGAVESRAPDEPG